MVAVPRNAVSVRFAGDDRLLRESVARSQRRIQRFGREGGASLNRLDRRFAAVGASARRLAAGIASISTAYASARAIRGAVEFADEIDKGAKAAGISAAAFQELRFAADLAGVEVGRFTKGFSQFNIALGEAQAGTGTLTTFLKAALLEALTTAGSAEEAFRLLAPEIEGAATDMEAAALASAAFGRRAGPLLAAALRDLEGGFEGTRAEARRLGIVLDDDLVASGAAAQDAITTFTTTLKANFAAVILQSETLERVLLRLSEIVADTGAGITAGRGIDRALGASLTERLEYARTLVETLDEATPSAHAAINDANKDLLREARAAVALLEAQIAEGQALAEANLAAPTEAPRRARPRRPGQEASGVETAATRAAADGAAERAGRAEAEIAAARRREIRRLLEWERRRRLAALDVLIEEARERRADEVEDARRRAQESARLWLADWRAAEDARREEARRTARAVEGTLAESGDALRDFLVDASLGVGELGAAWDDLGRRIARAVAQATIQQVVVDPIVGALTGAAGRYLAGRAVVRNPAAGLSRPSIPAANLPAGSPGFGAPPAVVVQQNFEVGAGVDAPQVEAILAARAPAIAEAAVAGVGVALGTPGSPLARAARGAR